MTLVSAPLLVRHNYNDTFFMLTTDASKYAIGVVLSNEKTIDQSIAYASRALVGTEERYHTIENLPLFGHIITSGIMFMARNSLYIPTIDRWFRFGV